ncbi:hypothetical protein FLTE109939_07355 [Flavobacterium terrigena]
MLSVTVTVYDPAARPDAVVPVPPDGDQEYEYGAIPPEGITVAVPLEPPKQDTFVCDPVAVLIDETVNVA